MRTARILLVHSDIPAEIIKTALELAGHRVDVAHTAAAAMARFAPGRFHVVFVGLKFSELTGEEFASMIKRLDPGQAVSIIDIPFLFQDLKQTVADFLDRRPAQLPTV